MLSIEDLNFSIGRTKILNGVSLTVKQGEKVGLIGPNGSGKTTLFNCISGFNLPTSGKLFFRGLEISTANPATRANQGIGRVFQNFGIFREMTVAENILTALESKSIGPLSFVKRGQLDDTMEYLELVKLGSKAKEKAGSLSGGQMRLLEITRAIAFGADLLLLDEPTAGVSPRMKQEIEEALHKLQELGKTIIIIEHDINFIQKICERIIVLDIGRVVLDDTPENVRNDPRLQEIYFGNTAGKAQNHQAPSAMQVTTASAA